MKTTNRGTARAPHRYLIRLKGRLPVRWDGLAPLPLNRSGSLVLEKNEGTLRLRDRWTGILPMGEILSVTDLSAVPAVNWTESRRALPFRLLSRGETAPEDRVFQRDLKRGFAAFALLLLAVFAVRSFEPDGKEEPKLIPAPYAKLILTRPKYLKPKATGGASAARAEARAVARAFQSKKVQTDMRSVLKTGLSRYSLMNSGKAVSDLSRAMSAEGSLAGSGTRKTAEGLLGAALQGSPRLGAETGYGSGRGIRVKGQGSGQLEVGLDTSEASVDEGLTREEVARIIHKHMNEIRYCYENGILRDPTLAGRLLVDFRINASGQVPQAGVSETGLRSAEVAECLLRKLRSWKFPEPRGGVVVAVTYPFIFKSLSR